MLLMVTPRGYCKVRTNLVGECCHYFMSSFFQELQNQFRWADALDIAIVSVLLYMTLTWFRERASRSLAVVFLTLVTLFLLARWLEMYLLTRLFQLGFVGIIVVLVIVFQHDIRYGFERLASLAWFRRRSAQNPSNEVVSTLSQALQHLASERIGALLVFPGSEPLDRHVRGGVPVDAEVSLPLLLSIFHPLTPGHDGAVLIREERISQLGLHLPLSTNLSEVHGGGTRHAAALGLSECCDALIVAVSEERGTISAGQAGRLVPIEPAAVSDHLYNYLTGHATARKHKPRWWSGNLVTQLLSICLATLFWFLFAYHTETVQRTIVIPIEYRNLPEGWVVQEPKATYAEVTLAGSDQAFNLLDVTKLRVSLEVQKMHAGVATELPTEPNLQNVPSELRVSQIIPRFVTVSIRQGN